MKSEKGQAIVFLALGFVVFLGFVGLALDGGMLYSDRRHAQNSADASSLAGAGAAGLVLANEGYNHKEITYDGWYCDPVLDDIDEGNDGPNFWLEYVETQGINAAIASGAINNFTLDTDESDLSYVTTRCEDEIGKYIDVTVQISDTTETSFAQVLYPQPLHNVVSATARIFPLALYGGGNAIIALDDECQGNDGGIIFGGDIDVDIYGGGIFSNACIVANGAPIDVTVSPEDVGNMCIGEDCLTLNPDIEGDDAQITPLPEEGDDSDIITLESVYKAPPTDEQCGTHWGSISLQNDADSTTINPGTYSDIKVTGGTLRLNPGLYCIEPLGPGDKGEIEISGGVVEGPAGYSGSEDDPFESGVTFYLTEGGFSAGGGALVTLTAAMPPDACEVVACPGINEELKQVLIYLADGNTSEIHLTGTDDNYFAGIIYAPTGDFVVSGTTGTIADFMLQVIANRVEINGDGIISISYDSSLESWHKVKIELAK